MNKKRSTLQRERSMLYHCCRALFVVLSLSLPFLPEAEAITVSSLTHERQAAPGESYNGEIEIVNNSDEPATIRVYQTDYAFQSDGSNSFGPAGKSGRSNAEWIDFSPNRITIPPHQTHLVNYTVKVPKDESLTGTYWSMFMVEDVNVDSGSGNPADNQTAISQVVRYGVQCITQIGSTGESNLQIVDAELTGENDDSKELRLDVKNDGERWAVPVVWTELYDHEGRAVGKFDGEKKRIFPGTSVRYRIQLADSLHGTYKALVVLDDGGENVVGAKYDLEF